MSAEEPARLIDLAREPVLQLGPLEVRPSTREVVVAGEQTLVLEPRVMQVLVALARRRGAVVSRDDLIAECWGGRVVGEDAISRCIQAIRKLADTHGGFSITTIARVGYRLVATECEDAAVPATTAPKRESPADPIAAQPYVAPAPPGRAVSFPRRPILLAALIAVIAAAGAGLWLVRDRLPFAAPVGGERVAILPFDVVTPEPEADAFASGLLDEILGVLSTDDVRVVPRSQSASLRGAGAFGKARALGAGLILDGTVERRNDMLTVRVHLDDPGQGVVLWSRDFEDRTSAGEALQAQVAARATAVATAALLAHRDRVTDPAVVTDYVTASEQLIFNSDAGLAGVVAVLQRVVARAPNFARGRALYACALGFQSLGVTPDQSEPLRREAERQARQALAIDPKSGFAYLALARTHPVTHWASAEAQYLKGLTVEPGNWPLVIEESRLQQQTGRLRAATLTAQRAVALDPFQPGPSYTLALLLAATGDPGQAGKLVDRMQALWPGHLLTPITRLWVAVIDGDPKSALAAAPNVRFYAMNDVARTAWQAYFAAQPPANEAARLRLTSEMIRTASAQGRLDPGWAMTMLAGLGDVDGAFAASDRYATAFHTYDPIYPPYLFLPQTAAMRLDPRFMKLAARLGLVDYWRTTGNWPDFCAEPGLPYNCKAEAARLASGRS
jgi:DNA-binding winged helix-turn-helix (wHTH) protein/TolB-like protein